MTELFIVFYLVVVSLLEGSLSGVEALRHLRLDLQSRKKVITPIIGLNDPCLMNTLFTLFFSHVFT